MALTTDEIREIVSEITYRDDWEINVHRMSALVYEQRCYLQVVFYDGDEIQKCRKWMLSPHMTKSEIVQTAFKAVLAAEEHECRERFRYKGRMIYGPHLDVDELAEFVRTKDHIDLRTGAWVA